MRYNNLETLIMPLFSTTLTTAVSTSPGASAIANTDRVGGKPITASVIPSAASSGAFVIQYTLDDIQKVTSTGVTWSGVGSSQGAQATVFVASASVPDGVFASFLSPVSAVRINSTALAGGSLTLKVNQGEGA
jgi:hypothetical protein